MARLQHADPENIAKTHDRQGAGKATKREARPNAKFARSRYISIGSCKHTCSAARILSIRFADRHDAQPAECAVRQMRQIRAILARTACASKVATQRIERRHARA